MYSNQFENTLPKFDIIIICIGHSERLEASLYYWSHMKYNNYQIHVITYVKDIKTIDICKKYLNTRCVIYENDDCHNKGKMIKYGISSIENIGEYIMLSDADIIFSPSTLLRISNSFMEGNEIISSYREDISERDILLFFSRYKEENINWVWENISLETIYPSPFMGWFLAFPSYYVNKINFIINHSGYDVVDWKIFSQLQNIGLKKKLIHINNVPLHIYHGNKGEQWKGINLQYF